MNALLLRKTRLITASCLMLLATSTVAQNSSVVESRGVTPGQGSASAASSSSNNDALSLLLEQNQQLRAELQAVRAMVEEQGFEIRKLQRDSLNRYTNMDDRLTALESAAARAPIAASPGAGAASTANPLAAAANNNAGTGNSSAALANTAGTGNNAIGGLSSSSTSSNTSRSIGGVSNGNTASNGAASSNRNSGRGTLQPAVLSEQQLYQMAYDSVINSNFERSLAEFDQYLSIYPQGRFVTNAHYWKGQAYLYLERFAEARDSYEMILEQYPDSAKLPDAMYGLGLAYQGLGNIPRARQLMNDIKRRFPNTGVANLADTRLLSLD
ncbi:MAG: tol-pal system protein YbgF [Pseudomonadales bacterium]|nr:tol-pal system protein YbgF [Pseudomonadales bacterium]